MPGEGARTSLRDRERAGVRRRAPHPPRARPGRPAQRGLSPAQVPVPQPRRRAVRGGGRLRAPGRSRRPGDGVGRGRSRARRSRRGPEARGAGVRAHAGGDRVPDRHPGPDPAGRRAGRQPLGRHALAQGRAAQAGAVFEGQPEAEARIRITIGRAYKALGENRLAETNLRRGIEILQGIEDTDPTELYRAMWALTHVLFALEKPDAMGSPRRPAGSHTTTSAASTPSWRRPWTASSR